MSETNLKKVIELFDTLSSVPTPQSAFFGNEGKTIHVLSTKTDQKRGKKHKLMNQYIKEKKDVFPVDFPSVLPADVTITTISPSGKYMVLIREDTEDKKPNNPNPTYWIEVYSNQTHLYSVKTEKKHGKVYTDDFFACASWNREEDKLVYCAEKFSTPKATYFQDDSDNSGSVGNKYEYQNDWGEQYNGMCTPRLFVFNVESKVISEVKGIASELSLGQGMFTPNSSGIVFTGVPYTTKRLGIIYCTNRVSSLYYIRLVEEKETDKDTEESKKEKKDKADEKEVEEIRAYQLTQIDGEDGMARMPSFSPNGQFLSFFCPSSKDAHQSCYKLRIGSWDNEKNLFSSPPTTLVDIVHSVKHASEFPGIFSPHVSNGCHWINDDHLVFSVIWRSMNRLIKVCRKTGKIESEFAERNISVLGISPKYQSIVISSSALNEAPSVHVGELKDGKFEWTAIQQPSSLPSKISQGKVEIIELKEKEKTQEIILLSPNSASPNNPLPLIVYPHGGPHSAFTNSYTHSLAFFCCLDYHILLVNFVGSIGFGQDLLDLLPGKIGTSDVEDVMHALAHVENREGIDKDRVCIFGGSHGGFLAGSAITLYPDRFKTAVLRNPVLNIPGMLPATDIPDWAFVEVLGYDNYQGLATPVTPDILHKMLVASPIYRFNVVKTPSIFLLGQEDRRVPMFQALDFAHKIQNIGVPVKIFIYPDPHAITKVDSDSDAWINVYKWLAQYCRK